MARSLLDVFHQYPAVNTDTRTIEEGQIYIALKGERFNGNQFAAQALEKGAVYAVIDEEEYLVEGDDRYMLVPDALKALQQLAYDYRQAFEIPVIGLTGSNGKTTTKELIASVLRTEKKIHATSGNFNNHIGVPLTLLKMPRDIEVAIIEMGANQPGDIQELAEIANPDWGLITNVGRAHLEKLKGIDGVRETKGAIFRHVIAKGGKIFVNLGDPNVVMEARDYEDAVTFGSPAAAFHLEAIKARWGGMDIVVKVYGETWQVRSSLTGEYNAMNILAAIAIGHTMGISKAGILHGIERYVSTNNRSQLIQRGDLSIWLDAYNANPSSMEASIQNVFAMAEGKKVGLVLGDMYELGDEEEQLHRNLAKVIEPLNPDVVIGVGSKMSYLIDELSGNVHAFADREAAEAQFEELIKGIDVLLVKGSRAMALEKLV